MAALTTTPSRATNARSTPPPPPTPTPPPAQSVRAKHTKLALSKALNVTITRAPKQASLRKMLQRSKGAKQQQQQQLSDVDDVDDELLQGFLGHGDANTNTSGTNKADEALAQVVLGVCEDAENHFETLVQETYANSEFANLDAWIEEAQEAQLRKRATTASAHKSDAKSDDAHTLDAAAAAAASPATVSPEMLLLAARQRVVDDKLRNLRALRVERVAELAQLEQQVELARRAAVSKIAHLQSAVAQVDSVRDVVQDFAKRPLC